jgi:hypothetical protein
MASEGLPPRLPPKERPEVSRHDSPLKWLALALGALAVLAGLSAVAFFTVPAHSLPSFLGPLPKVKAHRVSRGKAAALAAALLLVLAGAVFFVGRPQPSRENPPLLMA